MKKIFLLIFLLSTGITFSQTEKNWGIKAGLNYSSNGDLFAEIPEATNDIKTGSDSKVGFHFGVFGKLDFPKIYLRPELVYTKTKSDYDGADFDMSKLDLPVLLGYKIIGPLSVFAGPSFQYILDTDLEGTDLEDVENDFTVGLNVGAAVNLGNIGLDVRYERGFSENEASFISNNITDVSGRVDSRPSQLIFSLSLRL
ncbi:outer membrane beta-barrel protein [Abyssalbus ytuae]|uniref:PorT family protein n=1 Tax=Abyssalbus ytuae TaxID=2926907 RepID=A0A9E6ZT00_9FLAO|nr:outer membrane beta-barrel protein [Abyssalbus ytuae]UOB18288.1 PorT family protein [Abyssalbus ytuae]